MCGRFSACADIYVQLDSERQSREEALEAANSLRLEVECLKQDLDKKSLSLVSTQSELGTVTEVHVRNINNYFYQYMNVG